MMSLINPVLSAINSPAGAKVMNMLSNEQSRLTLPIQYALGNTTSALIDMTSILQTTNSTLSSATYFLGKTSHLSGNLTQCLLPEITSLVSSKNLQCINHMRSEKSRLFAEGMKLGTVSAIDAYYTNRIGAKCLFVASSLCGFAGSFCCAGSIFNDSLAISPFGCLLNGVSQACQTAAKYLRQMAQNVTFLP